MMNILMEVFLSMIGFASVIFCTLILFTLVRINIKKTVGLDLTSMKNFFLTLDYYYNSLYWSWDSIEDTENYAELLHHYFTGVFLALIMLNILISIATNTYSDFLEKKDLINNREQVTTLLDFSNLGSGISNIIKFFTGKKRSHSTKILCLIVEKDLVEESSPVEKKDLEELENKVELSFLNIQNQLRLMDEKFEKDRKNIISILQGNN